MPIESVQPRLAEIVAALEPGEELVLTTDGDAVAIVTRPPRNPWPSEPGTVKDRRVWVAPNFDAPLVFSGS